MEIVYRSDVGEARKNNEDSVGYFKNKAGVILALVADGLGGHQGGEVASEMAVSHLGYQFEQTDFYEADVGEVWLKKQVAKENETILAKASQYQDLRGMGTTLVCVLLFANEFILANIGDSRGYLLRDSQLLQLSVDHSLVNELVKQGKISPAEAKSHPHKNIITRTLGISEAAKLEINTYPSKAGDYLLLCSDGLTSMVNEEELQGVLETTKDLQAKCDELISLANEAGGLDNITLLIIHLDSEVSG